jgi:hypothetical protein
LRPTRRLHKNQGAMPERECQAGLFQVSSHPAIGRARKLFLTGPHEYLDLCHLHWDHLRVQGYVGRLELFEDLVLDHPPRIVLEASPFSPKIIGSTGALIGASCASCGRRLDAHEQPPIFVDEEGQEFE